MKKLLFVTCLSMLAATSPAQNVPFEGEIVYETYENYSDYIKKMANSIYFDGVHKIRLILKGDKMHMIDETTQCHVIATADNASQTESNSNARGRAKNAKEQGGASYVHFCDLTKTGMDFGKNIDMMRVLKNGDLVYPNGGGTAKLTTNTFAKTETKKNILENECTLYEGRMIRKMGGMDQTYDLKTYVSSSLTAPAGYSWNLYGLDIPGIALKWIQKYDGGHVSVMNVGELSYYIEADVVEVKPRTVGDDEFTIPADYKISTGAKNAFALMKYYSGVRKQLEKLGIKGGDKSQKQTGVHYKTNDEWDF